MTALRAIDPKPLVAAAGDLPALDAGKQPYLEWIAITALMVDPTYQRDITVTGQRNIVRIAREFEWARFATVVVTPHARGKFLIIDGQHRTTAAALRGVDKVPCQVVTADAAKQALAFAAINANVTKMSTMQLHAARVAAGDADAVRLKRVCESGGVTLLRYPVQTQNQKVGETMAVVQLRQALDRYGETALRVALQCITKTRDGNPGMVRGLIVLPLCAALDSNKTWLENPRLPSAFEGFDFAQTFADAGKQIGGFSRAGVHNALLKIFSAFLTATLDKKPPPSKPSLSSTTSSTLSGITIPGASRTAANGALVYNGIAVATSSGLIEFAEKSIKVRPRVAMMASVLARALPQPVDRRFLINRIWTGQRIPRDAAEIVNELANELSQAVAGLGLSVSIIKDVGIALVKA